MLSRSTNSWYGYLLGVQSSEAKVCTQWPPVQEFHQYRRGNVPVLAMALIKYLASIILKLAPPLIPSVLKLVPIQIPQMGMPRDHTWDCRGPTFLTKGKVAFRADHNCFVFFISTVVADNMRAAGVSFAGSTGNNKVKRAEFSKANHCQVAILGSSGVGLEPRSEYGPAMRRMGSINSFRQLLRY